MGASANEEEAAGPILAFATTVEAGDGFRMTRGIARGNEDAALAGSEQHPLNAALSDPSIAEEPRAAIVPIPTPRPARMVAKAPPVEVERRVSHPAAKQKQRWTRRSRPVERTLRTAESLPRQERRERLRRYWVTGGFR